MARFGEVGKYRRSRRTASAAAILAFVLLLLMIAIAAMPGNAPFAVVEAFLGLIFFVVLVVLIFSGIAARVRRGRIERDLRRY